MKKIIYSLLFMLAIGFVGTNLRAEQPLPVTNGSVYYYITFTRMGNNLRGVLTDKGDGEKLKTAILDPGNPAQLWKIEEKNGTLIFTSKQGNKIQLSGERFIASSTDNAFEFKIADCANPGSGSGIVYQLILANQETLSLNQHGGGGIDRELSYYYKDDAGGSLTFMAEHTVPLYSTANATDSQWYYMYYTRNTRGFVKDNGANANIVQTNNTVVYGSNDYLWRLVSNGDGTFYLESKNGHKVNYNSKYQTSTTEYSSFQLAGCSFNSDKSAHLPIIWEGNTAMNANGDGSMGQYSFWNDEGQSVLFIPENAPFKLSTEDYEYWYQIQFVRRSANGDLALTDVAVGSNLIQSPRAANNTQYWKFEGTSLDNFQIVSYAGNKVKWVNEYYKAASTSDNYSVLIGTYKDSIAWRIADSNSPYGYLNDKAGQYMTDYSADDPGSQIFFLPVTAEPEFEKSETNLDYGTINSSSQLTINVTARNLTSDISVVMGSEADASAFTISKAEGWSDRRGGDLIITFTPTASKTYTATMTINDETVTLSGTGSVLTSIPASVVDINAPTRYYNLQGLEIKYPIPGNIYIVKQGSKATKMMIRK